MNSHLLSPSRGTGLGAAYLFECSESIKPIESRQSRVQRAKCMCVPEIQRYEYNYSACECIECRALSFTWNTLVCCTILKCLSMMSISSFNLKHQPDCVFNTNFNSLELCRISPIDRHPASSQPQFESPTLSQTQSQLEIQIKIRANNRFDGDDCIRTRDLVAKSHSHSGELDAINVIININNVIGHKNPSSWLPMNRSSSWRVVIV